VIDQLARVILDTTDEARLASPKNGKAEGVEPGRVDDASVVAQVTLVV
jgi:hypothetical protein